MMQSGVLGYAYRSLRDRLESLATESGMYTMVTGSGACSDNNKPSVNILVTDICQIAQDKNGQRIVVDELRYELPSLVAVSISLVISGNESDTILDVAGCISGYMKDNPVISAGEYNWHGNSNGRIYVEPIIRGPTLRQLYVQDKQQVVMEYCFEAGINSGIGEAFTRVEKREVRSDFIT